MDEVSTNQYAIGELSLEREFITDIAVCLELICSNFRSETCADPL